MSAPLNAMTLWHQTGEAPCRVSFGDGAWWLDLEIGTWPIEAGQSVSIEAIVSDAKERGRPTSFCDAIWKHNRGGNSYWSARLGPFKAGDNVEYSVKGKSASWTSSRCKCSRCVSARNSCSRSCGTSISRCIATSKPPAAKGSFILPWVRLHCVRDYYSMAALLICHPNVRLTINLTPVLLRQIEAYVEDGCTDRALDLTLTPTSELTAGDREYIATQFFDADWHHEIYPHAAL